MRILLINQSLPPDGFAIPIHAGDLSRALVAEGHEVIGLASRSYERGVGSTLPGRSVEAGMEVHRVGANLLGRRSLVRRGMDAVLFLILAAWKVLTVPKPDVVVCFTAPPLIGVLGFLARLRGCLWVNWVMDLYPDVAISCGVLREGSLPERVLSWVGAEILRRADRNVVLGRCMEDRLRAKGVAPEKIVLVAPWADADELLPVPDEDNEYRKASGRPDAVRVMYAGNFGRGHDLDTLCAAAVALRDDPSITFTFVGWGHRRQAVKAFVAEQGLDNAEVLPRQPAERLAELLSSADVHVVSLDEKCTGTMVPCRLLSLMSVARPAVFVGGASAETGRVLEEHACGRSVRQGDVDGLVAALQELAGDRSLREQMGVNARQALVQLYSRERGCERWVDLLHELVPEAVPARPVEAVEPVELPVRAASREEEQAPPASEAPPPSWVPPVPRSRAAGEAGR